MKRLLILKVPELETNYNVLGSLKPSKIGFTLPDRALFEAGLVIVKTPTHFRCVKNRWESQGEHDEKIPNYLLKDFILRYKDYFTNEELIDSLL